MSHLIEREQLIPCPVADVFSFFSDAANLERLTPPHLHFQILSEPPITMRSGAVIDYQLSLFGVPFRWRTLIESFEAPRQFTDIQIRGPYRRWRHVHQFEPAPGGTRMRDRVEYEVPLWPLGEIASALFITRQVERIFDFRQITIRDIFRPLEGTDHHDHA